MQEPMIQNPKTNLFEYLDYREFLHSYMEERKADNPHYSLRMVAYKLGCNPGFFTRILKGARNLSPQLILKLGEFLKFNAKQKHYFELLVNYNQAKKQVEKDHFFHQLDIFRTSKVKETSIGQHAMYSQWYYIVLRELIELLPCKSASEETFRMLSNYFEMKVTPDQIRLAFKTLDDLGILKRKSDGAFTVKERFISSGKDIPQVIVNRVLLQFMELAKMAVDRFPREERSLSTLTFSVSDKGFQKIREKLDQYRREILSIVSEGGDPVDRVCHLNMHLFPVTKPYKGGTE
jgi:uncharacterized protein (TIGR02147 family)